MFLVQNTTRRTIILSDIRTEIGPRKVIDLERIVERQDLDKSRDLAFALKNKQLAIFRRTIIHNKEGKQTIKMVPDADIVENIIKNHTISESKMRELIKDVLSESKQETIKEEEKTKKTDTVIDPEIQNSLQKLLKVVENIQSRPQQVIIKEKEDKLDSNLSIDPAKLAELQKEPVKKLHDQLKGSTGKKSRKIKLDNFKDISKLANELED